MKSILVLSNGVIGEIVEEGDEFPVAPPCHWMIAPDDVARDWVVNGESVVPPPVIRPTDEEALNNLKIRARQYIEDTAREHRYGLLYPDSPSLEAALSVNSTAPAIAANSQAFVAWRDRQLAYLDYLATQIANGAAIPTPDALVAQMHTLDPMVWPS